jgi:hypothetical protein
MTTLQLMAGERHIEIEVITADALRFDVDVLVLKHAQVSLGVDAAAKELLGLNLEMELGPGGLMAVSGQPALGAERVIFLGVPRLEDFGYGEIRLFARRAMSVVASEFPDARKVALTLHGAGYGLDEIACFDAELAGLLDALDWKTVSPALERVLILESDPRRAQRLRDHLVEKLSDGRGGTGVAVPPGAAVVDRLGESALAAQAERDHAFIAMPFSVEFEDVFHYGIASAVRANGLLCERIDQAVFTGNILARMKERISAATLLVADLTGANPNVYLEVGFAWAASIPTVLVYRSDSELKFDVQGERCLSYGSIKELEERLTGELKQLVV